MMKILRRILVLLYMVFILFSAVRAEEYVSIIDMIKCVEHKPKWTATYDAYGRTIEIDCPMIVPSVEKIPIITVELQSPLSPEWLKENECIFSDEGENELLKKYNDYGLTELLGIDVDSQEVCSAYIPNEEAGAVPGRIWVSHLPPIQLLGKNLKFESISYYPFEIQEEETFAENNPLSLSDAKKCLRKILDYYYTTSSNDYSVDYVEIRGRGRKVKSIDDKKLGDYTDSYPMGTYYISFRQNVRGIPIYTDMGAHVNIADNEAWKVWKTYESITGLNENCFDFMNYNSFDLSVKWFKEKQTIATDVPLVSIEQIVKSIEKEIAAGRIRNVYALKLGYCVFLKDQTASEICLFPMWLCECEYFESEKRDSKVNPWSDDFRKGFNYARDGFNFAKVGINAQTGEIVDRMKPSKESLYCPKVLTW